MKLDKLSLVVLAVVRLYLRELAVVLAHVLDRLVIRLVSVSVDITVIVCTCTMIRRSLV